MFVIFLNINQVQKITPSSYEPANEITASEYFQYLRRICPTHISEAIKISSIISKFRKKFGLTEDSVKAILRDYIDQNIIEVGYDDEVRVNILANYIRKQIFVLVQQYPGLYTYKIQKYFDVGVNQILWHLSFLQEFQYIIAYQIRKATFFADISCDYERAMLGFMLLKTSLRSCLQFILKKPNGATIDEILTVMDVARSQVFSILKKLQKLKIVQKSLETRGLYLINETQRQVISHLIQCQKRLAI